MALYRIWDMTVASTVAIPELPPSPSTRVDWTFSIRRDAGPRHADWFHQWRLPDGRRWLQVARHEAGYRLRFQFADFDVMPRLRVLQCYRRGAPLHTIRHLLLDQVLPLIAGGPRRLALHASAVAMPSGAVGFLGETGYGKSTIAAALARNGYPLIADDCLLVIPHSGRVDAIPAYPGVRLNADSSRRLFGGLRGSAVSHVSRKRRIGVRSGMSFLARRCRVSNVYVLEPDDRMRRADIAPLRRRDAMMAVVKYVFHLDVRDRSRVRSMFDLTASFVENVEIRRLRFPRRLDGLDAVIDALSRDVH